MNGRDTAGFDALYGRFWNRVSILAQIVFDVIFIVADLVGPDGATILEVNDVRWRGQRR